MNRAFPSNSFSSFEINTGIFNAVSSEISNVVPGSVPQPVVIVGEEGSGKSTLLRRLYASCNNHERVWLDGRYIFDTADIIDNGNISDGVLLFIDNLDFYLTRCSYDEQFRLRRFLYNEGAPMLIATVSKILPALAQYEAPFFEGLKLIYIQPVSNEDIRSLVGGEDYKRAVSLMALVSPTIHSLQLVWDIINLNSCPHNDVYMLLSFLSGKYWNIYKGLPTNSQHILNAFGGSGDNGMTIPEIRDKSGLSTSILTAYLKSLRVAGIISVDKPGKRNTIYSVKDPLLRIWLDKSTPELFV